MRVSAKLSNIPKKTWINTHRLIFQLEGTSVGRLYPHVDIHCDDHSGIGMDELEAHISKVAKGHNRIFHREVKAAKDNPFDPEKRFYRIQCYGQGGSVLIGQISRLRNEDDLRLQIISADDVDMEETVVSSTVFKL